MHNTNFVNSVFNFTAISDWLQFSIDSFFFFFFTTDWTFRISFSEHLKDRVADVTHRWCDAVFP